MADISQAVQECIDDYFKREAGGMGLLVSTQPSSSSLSSAQPLGAGITPTLSLVNIVELRPV